MNKIKKIVNKNFVRNVMIVATGTIAAQAITLIFAPFITRIYGPEAYGVLGVFVAAVNIIAPIAALTYPTAIVLPEKDKDAILLGKISFYGALLISALVMIVIIFLKNPIVGLLQIESIAPFLYFIPLVIIFSALMQVIEQWLIRKKLFKMTAKITFFQSLILNSSKVGGGLASPSAAMLVLLATLGNGLKAIMLFWSTIKSDKNFLVELKNEKLKFNESKFLLKKYVDFPAYRAPQVFIDSITQSLPIIMLTTLFGPASAGFYSIGRTVLGLPTQLIAKSVGDVFYPRISEASKNGENINVLLKKATIGLLAIGVIPFGIVIVSGPWLFSFVFGSEWSTAGEYARWMALWMYFSFSNQPCVRALPILSAQAFHLKFTIITLMVRSLALITGYFFFENDIVAVMFFSVSGSVLNIILIASIMRISKGIR